MKFIDYGTIMRRIIFFFDFENRNLIIDIRDGNDNLGKRVSGIAGCESEMIIVIGLNN